MTPAPRFLFLSINSSCPLRCQHCRYWQQSEDPERLTMERLAELCEEFAELAPGGRVVLCGGEPMLEASRYFGVCQAARSVGLRVLSVVSGLCITTRDDARRLLEEGPHEVSISFDDWRWEIHDALRGIPGAFDRARRALALLCDQRYALGAAARVNIMALVHAGNVGHLAGFVDLRDELGADKVKWNLLQPSFGGCGPDICWARYGGIDPARLVGELRALDSARGLNLNPAFLEAAADYCRAIGRVDRSLGWGAPVATDEQLCDSGERNIMVDVRGVARLCFASLFPGVRLERRGDLRRFWEGADWRERMRTCRLACGISHSVRRVSGTLKGGDHADA